MKLLERTFAVDEGTRLIYQVPLKCIVSYDPNREDEFNDFCLRAFMNHQIEIMEEPNGDDLLDYEVAVYGDIEISVGRYQDNDQVLSNEIFDLMCKFDEICTFIDSIKED